MSRQGGGTPQGPHPNCLIAATDEQWEHAPWGNVEGLSDERGITPCPKGKSGNVFLHPKGLSLPLPEAPSANETGKSQYVRVGR